MFQDEGRFGLLGSPRRCWAPHGTRPVVRARLERKYIYAFSAASPHDGVLDSLVLPWVSAETMSLFLSEVAQRHAEEFIVMVMDQAGWHIAGDLAVPQNMRLIFLPPYSPELNPCFRQRPGWRIRGWVGKGVLASPDPRTHRPRIQSNADPINDWIRMDNFYIFERKLVSNLNNVLRSKRGD